MNCHLFETLIIDIARGVDISAEDRKAAEEHFRICASCESTLVTQKELSRKLSMYRSTSMAMTPPPMLEQKMLTAFRGSTVSRQPKIFYAKAAAIFVLLISAVIAYRLMVMPGVSSEGTTAPQIIEARKSVAPESATPQNSEFMSIYTDSPSAPVDLVRVKLNRSALIELGLPVNLNGADDPVVADVVLGEDGVPQAIRLVSY